MAGILATRVATGRTAQDREMLPAILREWGVDVTKVRGPSGVPVWEFLMGLVLMAIGDYITAVIAFLEANIDKSVLAATPKTS